MEAVFDGGNLRIARFSLGLSYGDVADRVGKSRQYIQQIEIGQSKPSDELVGQLADVLEVYESFFFHRGPVSFASNQLHFRKLESTLVSHRQQAFAQAETLRRLVEFVESRVKLPEFDIPAIGKTSYTALDIEKAAENLREKLGLGIAPIGDISNLVECNGVIIADFGVVADKIDALSVTSSRPMIVRNTSKQSACRQRFDIAHEIGHMVLHQGLETGDRLTEMEANRFASSFMLPRAFMVKFFPRPKNGRMDWVGISELKMHCKVSKAAIVYRARQLDLIEEDTYKKAFAFLRRGEAKVENEDHSIEKENPKLLLAAVKFIVNNHGLTIDDIARQVGIRRSRINTFLGGAIHAPKLTVVK